MKELNSFDVSKLVKEVEFLVDGKIDKVYQIDKKDIYLQIYVKGKQRQLLRIVAGKYFYLTKTKPDFPENLQRFCSFLRKYIANSRIKSFGQVDHERIIKFNFETKTGNYDLFVELFGKGIFAFVKNDKIISVSEEQIWADRTLKPGEKYVYPKKLDSKNIFDKYKKKGSNITMKLLDEELSVEVIKSQKKVSAKEKEIKKLNNIVQSQTQQLEIVLKKADENKAKGNIIYNNYQEIEKIIIKIKSLKGESWVEIKKQLKSNKLFKDIKEKEGKLILEI